MAQAVGIIDIIWRGKRIPVEKGSTIKLGGLQNKTVAYGRGAAFTREFVQSHVKVMTILLKGEKASDIYSEEEGELQAQLDTGQTITAPAAWMTDRPEITGGEGGKISLQWEFGAYEEIS